MTSVTGYVIQNQLRPSLENIQPSGTKRNTVLTTVSIELLKLCPTAWKNTGNISEVTIGMKLIPTKRKPTVPISITALFEVNTDSIGPGIITKHSVPRNISTMPKSTEVDRVFLQRCILPAA